MNISTFARRAGISPSGVRWYEAAGVLPSPVRRENGYREYSDADLSRLTLILALRRLGLTPVEAGQLVDRCLEGEVIDPALTATLEQQRRNIARQREELERLEIELVDLERTIAAVDRGQANPVPIGVLFVCNGNSARSQIAEALLGRFGDPDFGASSAGTKRRSRFTRSRSASSPRSASTGRPPARSPSTSCSTGGSTTSSPCPTARVNSARACPARTARCTGTSRTRAASRGPRSSAWRPSARRARTSPRG